MVQHLDITGSDAVHPSDYYASADPGAVGAGKSWKDTTTTPPVQKRRNAANTGWDVVLDPSTFPLNSLLTTLGDVPYASGVSTWARLAGNATATRKFYRQTGTGSVSAAPAWDTLVAGDIPSLDASKVTSGTFATAQIPNLDASKITAGTFTQGLIPGLDATKIQGGVLDPARIPSIEPGYFASHINGGGGLDIWYWLGNLTSQSSGTSALAVNTLYAVPFVAPARGATLDRLAFNVTTLGAGNARAGIYSSTSATNIYPNSLIVDGGGISTGTTGVKAATISQALTAGALYWAVLLADNATAVMRTQASGTVNAILGVDSTLTTAGNRGLTVTQTYGALPGTFPAGAGTTGGVVPAIYGRYSA